MVSWHKAASLRLLLSSPDLVRTAPFHKVPGQQKSNNYLVLSQQIINFWL